MTRRPALVAVAMLLLAFCVGGLTGMALDEAFGLDWFDFLEEDDDSLEDDFFAGLDLSEAQEERIEEILDEQEDRLEAYWETRARSTFDRGGILRGDPDDPRASAT